MEKTINNKSKTIKVRFLDEHIEKLYNQLKMLPEYKKALSPLFNDAIRLGIPKLYDEIFGEVEINEDDVPSKMYDQGVSNEQFFDRAINLLQEINMNVVMTRSTVYSIYELLKHTIRDEDLKNRYQNGEFADTPEYLREYEDYVISELDDR